MDCSHLRKWILTGSLASALLGASPIAAQVIPDATLPVGERSQVTGTADIQIDGGARRGDALFHSFSQFSIPTGGSAFFNNAVDVKTIFSRVTGGIPSNIDGLIRSNGTANLFLLNPNGILFGPNASLNIGGSFVATTANAIGFPNGEVFSSDATQPLPSQLLNVNANALFFNQLAAQAIVHQSTANNGIGLQVPAGQNLLLVGGDVRLEGGQIVSPGSQVELGALAGQGIVELSGTIGDWQLNFPAGVVRADVFLTNSALIDVRAGSGGSIAVTARNLTLSEGSRLRSGINDGLGFVGAQAGDIQLNATEAINLVDVSQIRNDVILGGIGNAGNINVTARSVVATGGSALISIMEGQGNAGSININARDTVSLDGFRSAAVNFVQSTGIGNVGDINITTGSLFLTNSAQLISFTAGQGNAGSININARDTVSLDGYSSAVFNNVDPTGIGKGGDINITAGSLSFTRGAGLISYTEGQGDAGNVNINVRDTVSLDGFSSDGFSSSVVNIVNLTGIGNAGDINITADSLSLTRGASLYSYTAGQGNAGSVNINVRDRVSLDGENPIGAVSSSIFTQVYPEAVGQGGAVNITTSLLSLTNGGAVNTTNIGGIGNSGRVAIQAHDSVRISGTSPTLTDNRSGVFTSAADGAVGDGGNVTITTGSLFVSDQGRIITDITAGAQGKAGDIQIQASASVLFDGGDAISTLSEGGVGRGGDIVIEARSLSLLNNAQLSASTSGDGDAGNITASADTVNLINGGQLLTTTFSTGQAGNITVNTPNLQLSGATTGLFAQTTTAANAGDLRIQPRNNGQNVRVNLQDGAQISASTSSSGRGGTLTISAPESISLTGNGSVIAAETGGTGIGGNLILATGDLSIQNQAQVTVSSSSTGSAGNLFVDANRIFLNNQASIRADTSGGGGNIRLSSPLILLRNGSNITTDAKGDNIPGGNIGIDTRFLIAVLSEDSNISANSEDFRGGNVSINAFSIFGIQPSLVPTPLSDITATGATSALGGTIDVITAGIDLTSGLVELPTDLVDASGLIAQGCLANRGNSFTITGRGGLPPTPEQQLEDTSSWQDRRRLTVRRQVDKGERGDADFDVSAQSIETRRHQESFNSKFTTQNSKLSSTPIIEANSWQVISGEIRLVTNSSSSALQNALNHPPVCRER
jgi:filamentous hemagglutinin family protein